MRDRVTACFIKCYSNNVDDEVADKPPINLGLEGIYFAESRICRVDGQSGKLYYRGYPIEELAAESTYEEVCYLLLYGRLPTKPELETFTSRLRESRQIPPQALSFIRETSKKAHPMDTLRTAISALPAYDKDAYDNSGEANLGKSIRLISQVASITAAIGRFRQDRDYVQPDESLSHAENLLYMLRGSKPSKNDAKIIDMLMLLHAEHSSNASTFTTIAAGSTLSDMYAAVTAGIAALKGPLHGGEDEAALRMIRAIGNPDNTEKYIDEALSGKQRIMGFGHRIYKTYDPRARIIRSYLMELQNHSSEEVRRLTAIELRAEKLMVERLGKQKGIWPNVDFFSGPVYLAVGIPPELFTPLFAVSRMVGWCSHMIEYWQSNRLIRPLDYYSGDIDLKYVPIGKR